MSSESEVSYSGDFGIRPGFGTPEEIAARSKALAAWLETPGVKALSAGEYSINRTLRIPSGVKLTGRVALVTNY
jgi:hypothetical protein